MRCAKQTKTNKMKKTIKNKINKNKTIEKR